MRAGWLMAGFGRAEGSEDDLLPELREALRAGIEAWADAASDVGKQWHPFDAPITEGPDESIRVTAKLNTQV